MLRSRSSVQYRLAERTKSSGFWKILEIIHAHLIGGLLVVRPQGVLTAAEQHLVKSLPAEKGRDLLKQVRTHLMETARPTMETLVQGVTGVKVLSLHHDISTATVEEVVVFILAQAPAFREIKKG